MKNKTLNKLQISLIVLAIVLLIVMNVFTFDPITLNVLRVLLASCLFGFGILRVTRIVKTHKTES